MASVVWNDWGIGSFCTSPFSGFVIVTVLTNAPMIYYSVKNLDGIFHGCHGSWWLLGSLIFAAINVLVALYLSYRVSNPNDEKLRDRHTSLERITFLLCHDRIVCFYILIWFCFVGWLALGLVWAVQGELNDDVSLKDTFDEYVDKSINGPSKCEEDVVDNCMIVLAIGWSYFILGPAVLSCVVCCACFSDKDYAASIDEEFEAKAATDIENNNDGTTDDENHQYTDSDTNSDDNITKEANYTTYGDNKTDKTINDADVRNPASPPDYIEKQELALATATATAAVASTSTVKGGGSVKKEKYEPTMATVTNQKSVASQSQQTEKTKTYSVEDPPPTINEVHKDDAANNRVQAVGGGGSDFVSSISNFFTAPTTATTSPSPSAPPEDEQQVIPEVVAEPISSSAAQPTTTTTAARGGGGGANTTTSTAAATTATATIGSMFGGWFGNDGDDEIRKPRHEATLY